MDAMLAAIVMLASAPLDGAGCAVDCPQGAIAENEPCGAEVNRGCFGAPGDGSNCCIAWGGEGCDNARCEAIVCEVDSFCCTVSWDGICAAEAISVCPELCAGAFPQAWTAIAPGQTICGSSWADGSLSDDADWFEITLGGGEPTELMLTLTALLPLELSIIDNDGVPDCSGSLELEPSMIVAECGTVTLTACLEPGTHWILVRPALEDGYPCGAGMNDYVLEATTAAPRCALPDPVNDTCVTALPIGLGATTVSTKDGATEPGTPPVDCQFDGIVHRDVWWRHTAVASGTLRLSTCGMADFGAVLVVYGGDCDALVERACTSGSPGCTWSDPEIDIDVVEGEEILVRLGGELDTEGALVITLSMLPCRPVYELEIIEPLMEHLDVIPYAVSPAGEIAGTQSNAHGYSQGFRWSEDGGYEVVTPSMSLSAGLFDVNSNGTAVGWIIFTSSLISPAIAEGLTLEQLPGLPGKVAGRARGINESGVIVGELAATATALPAPVIWVDRVPMALPVPADTDRGIDINDLGDVCGTGKDYGAPFQEGWVLIEGEFAWIPSPLGEADVLLRAINNVGQVAGELLFDPALDERLGFVWDDGEFTFIEPPAPYESSDVYDVNDAGVIVGHLDALFGVGRPFVMRGAVPVPINTRLLQLEDPLRQVRAITEEGIIVGTVGGQSPQPARLVPVPPNGDLDCSGVTDAADLGRVLAAWGPCPANTACGEDLNVDGVVDGADVGIVLANWGPAR